MFQHQQYHNLNRQSQQQRSYVMSQHQLTQHQIEENIVPEWKKKYVDVSLVDQCLHQLQTDGVQADTNYINGIIDQQIQKAAVFIDDQIMKFTDKYHDLKDSSGKMLSSTGDFKEKFITNIFELYKHISLLQNFGAVNAAIVQYFVDSAQGISIEQNINDFTDTIDSNYNSLKFTDTQFYRSKKLSVAKLLSKSTRITMSKAQTDLDRSLLPPQARVNNERFTHIMLGFNIALALLIFITFCTELTWYLDIPGLPSIDFSKFQEYIIRYQMGFSLYCLIMSMIFRVCERIQINWLFILGIEKAWCPVGAKQLFDKALFSFSVQCFFNTLSLVCKSTNSHSEVPILEMQFGYLLSKLSTKIDADYWLLFPLILYGINICRGIFEIVTKQQKMHAYLLRIQLSLLFPYLVQPRMGAIIASYDLASIPQIPLHLGIAFQSLVHGTDLPGWGKFMLYNYPVFIRECQLLRLLRIKPGIVPHGLNMIKFACVLPFTLTFFKTVYDNKAARLSMYSLEVCNTLFKIYWDTCQDFGLFISGQGSNKFKNKRSEWKHPILCRRPTCLSVPYLTFAVIFNAILRFNWAPKYFGSTKFLNGFIYDSIYFFTSVIRVCFQMLVRLDNYQATNQEDLLVNNYVPLPIERNLEQKQPPKGFNVNSYELVSQIQGETEQSGSHLGNAELLAALAD